MAFLNEATEKSRSSLVVAQEQKLILITFLLSHSAPSTQQVLSYLIFIIVSSVTLSFLQLTNI